MKFAFRLRQRVVVPHSNGTVQGIIVAAQCGTEIENIYGVRALTDDGKMGTVDYSEADLLAAMPKTEPAPAAKAKR